MSDGTVKRAAPNADAMKAVRRALEDTGIAICEDIQRIKCMCGETVCSRCKHRMTACQAVAVPMRYCPACGNPLVARALNRPPDGLGKDR